MSEGAFARYAFAMVELGLSPIPTQGPVGKTPLLRGYTRGLVNLGNVVKMAATFPNANLALVTGPSNLVVVDIDAPELLARMLDRFGNTPLQVRTAGRGGYQLFYRARPEISSRDLRNEGLAVEIKAQGAIVVIPPSQNFETLRFYEFVKGAFDDATLSALPMFPIAEARLSPVVSGAPKGRRNSWLFRQCLHHARFCDTLEDLLDFATTRNEECDQPLEAREIQSTANSAWRYQTEGRNFAVTGGGVALSRPEIDTICKIRRGDPLALMLRLKIEHGARRDAEFRLASAAMASSGVIDGWSRSNYRTAIRAAVRHGWLIRTADSKMPTYRIGCFAEEANSSPQYKIDKDR